LELTPPTEEDNISCQRRILNALMDAGYGETVMTVSVLRALHPLCREAGWKVTATLAYDGGRWHIAALEAGNTAAEHYGLAVDLGSTTVVMQLVNCNTGEVIAQESAYNHQIAFGEDILTRIFYGRGNAAHLEEIRQATVDTITELMDKISEKSGICAERCISMVLAGNTTMTHFLIGMDAFCVFSSPYAVCADQPGFLDGRELGIPIPGYVYCYPGKANYLGGDIISGLVATGMHRRETISLFFDVGTNGELVVGNRDFLLCGAGAAGPALEGGVVKTGMRAADGAVEHVRMRRSKTENGADLFRSEKNAESELGVAGQCFRRKSETDALRNASDSEFEVDVIGGGAAKGICGSGIIDLITELVLCGDLDLRGRLVPENSGRVIWRQQEAEYAVSYAPGLWFYQSDISEFIRTKAAAYTMMEYLLSETGMGPDDVRDFYMAGAFGSHVRTESAINIGMYPDVDPTRIHAEGNTSLEGARKLLLDVEILRELPRILELMTYVQFGAVEDFLEIMVAASALPHTDIERYPSVAARLAANRKAGENAVLR
ncbi:MAG: ASKHA domain-containing protein, partial [Lachnospiraceae bacterium]|nr:ASKHA domain-containing protein [Lachnospiraceae bacterium]